MDETQAQTNPSNIPSPVSQEDQLLEKVKTKTGKKFLNSPKFQQWYRLFTDKSNKDTFGNSTQAAIQAYNLDPVTQYGTARVMGCENLAKLNNAASDILHKKGLTFNAMLEIGIKKMIKSNSFDPWLMYMEMLGYPVPNYKPITSPVYNLQQINNNIEGGVTVYGQLTDEQLDALIESKRRKIGTTSITPREGAPNVIESTEVHAETPQAVPVSNEQSGDQSNILG